MMQKGFTIIELIITVAVLASGVIGVYAAFYPVITTTNTMAMRLQAAYLAQEGIEMVRSIRDNNSTVWSAGLTHCQLGCQADYQNTELVPYHTGDFLHLDAEGFYGYAKGSKTPFTRKITINTMGPDILHVEVVVTFDDNGKQSTFQTQEYLYNYQ